MSEIRRGSTLIWIIAGLLAIAALVGVSAGLRSQADDTGSVARSASVDTLFPLVVANLLPTAIDLGVQVEDPFFEGRDVSTSLDPQLTVTRRELGSGSTSELQVTSSPDNGYWLVSVRGSDGLLIGSFEVESYPLVTCATGAPEGASAKDCAQSTVLWFAGAPPSTSDVSCPAANSRRIGQFTDPSGIVRGVTVVASCPLEAAGGRGGILWSLGGRGASEALGSRGSGGDGGLFSTQWTVTSTSPQ